MSTGIFFTIIVPAYNVAVVLPNCLQSIAQQSFTGYEVLLMDGGSTDATLSVAGSFVSQMQGHLSIHSEKDKGVYDAMNKGIAKAAGQYIIFLGADDHLAGPEVLQQVFDDAAVHKLPQLLYGDVITSHQVAAGAGIYGGAFTMQRLVKENMPHQAVFYHRSVFEQFGTYNLAYPVYADWDLNLRIFEKVSHAYTGIKVAHFASGGLSDHKPDHAFNEAFFSNRYYMVLRGKKLPSVTTTSINRIKRYLVSLTKKRRY